MNARRSSIGTVAALAACAIASLGLVGCSSGKAKAGDSAGGPSATSSAAKGSGASGSATAAASPTSGSASASKAASASAATTGKPSVPIGPSGGAVPGGFKPYSSTFVSASDGWVFGTAPCAHAPCGSVVRTTNGGKSWAGIPAPEVAARVPGTQATSGASIIRFPDARNGWVAGYGLFSTHNGGSSWRQVHLGPANAYVDSLETGGGSVYAVVGSCTKANGCARTVSVYAAAVGSDSWTVVARGVTAYGSQLVVHGASWYFPTTTGVVRGSGRSRSSTLPNPCPKVEGHPNSGMLAVADSSHLDALCSGEGGAGSVEVQLFGTSDGGHSWSKAGGLHKMVPADLTGLADNAHGVLLIATASGDSVIIRSTDDGRSLHNAFIAPLTGGYVWSDLGFTTSSQAEVTMPGRALYLSHDAGRSWSRVSF